MPTSEPASDFDRIERAELRPITVTAQCLDNQWVPQDLLQEMLDKNRDLTDSRIARRRVRDARNEYMRALLNAEQVIVNRAYFFNNPVVYRDYSGSGPRRTAFTRFLNTGALIPFLIFESGPGERPGFAIDECGWSAWRSVLPEVEPRCLRLSWDDGENKGFVQASLYQRFRRFLATMPVLDRAALQQDLSLDHDDAGELLRTFREIALWSMSEENPTREELYKRFVVRDGTEVAAGAYDPGKPFASQIKQLADLRYLTSLPDILDKFPLTPANSLHRTALQEERQLQLDGIDPDALADVLLQRHAFELVQEPLEISLEGLELPEIWAVRQTEEWRGYIATLERLLDEPQAFHVRAQQVYDSYLAMTRRLAGFVARRRSTGPAPAWAPTIKVIVEALGATLSIVYGDTTTAEVSGTISALVAAESSTAVVRLVVGQKDRLAARRQLSTGIDAMRVKFQQSGRDWAELTERLNRSGIPVRHVADDLEDDSAIDGGERHNNC